MLVFWILLLVLEVRPPTAAGAAGDLLAEVNGSAVTRDEVDKSLAGQLSKLEEQIYLLKRQRVDALIEAKLLANEAAKRNTTVPKLLDAEVVSKTGLVTESEVENVYQSNKAKFAGTETEGRERVRTYLQDLKLTQRRREFLDFLRSQAKVTIYLKAPPILRADVKVDGAPFKGDENAPITIVEFTDFHCPFCKRALPMLDQLLSRYGEKVKLVFKDFPIDRLHPSARKAHEAARCANEQGKFWPYHDKIFATAPKASPDNLKTYGKDVGLDAAAFELCFNSRKHQAEVENEIEEGRRAGVTGTPTFFINGRLVVGAKPLAIFARMIDEELAQ